MNPVFTPTDLVGVTTVPVTVRVTDSEGLSSTASTTVTILHAAPTVDLGGDAAIDPGDTFTQTGSFTGPPSGPWTGTVDYGDGSGSQTLAINSNNTFPLSHTYPQVGIYTVTVDIEDAQQTTGEGTLQVTVGNPVPVASIETAGSQTVSSGGSTVSNGGSVDVGSTPLGQPQSASFWIYNNGTAPLVIDPNSLSLPAGFSVAVDLPASVAPGGHELFALQLDAAVPGSYGGTVSFTTNDPAAAPFQFTLSGQVQGDSGPITVGDFGLYDGAGGSSFSTTTCNPTVSGLVEGDFQGGYVQMDFSLAPPASRPSASRMSCPPARRSSTIRGTTIPGWRVPRAPFPSTTAGRIGAPWAPR